MEKLASFVFQGSFTAWHYGTIRKENYKELESNYIDLSGEKFFPCESKSLFMERPFHNLNVTFFATYFEN